MVEFAIAASLVLLVLFGIIDYGRFLYTYHAIYNGAREGSRWAIVHGSSKQADIQTYVRTRIPYVPSSDVTVTATWPDPKASPNTNANPACAASASSVHQSPGYPVCVEVDYTFKFAMLPYASKSIRSTSQMIISQ